MGFDNLLPIIVAFSIVTISPGPANIALATVAMSSGRENGLLFGLGLSFGLAFWGFIAATGLGVVLQASEYALLLLKVFGGVYLLWLACQSGFSALKQANNLPKEKKQGQWFFRGLILNLSNPKAVVAWMAALSMGLTIGDNSTHVLIATVICAALGFLNYTIYALVFSVSGMMFHYQRFRRWIEGVVAGLFALAGFSLIKSTFSR